MRFDNRNADRIRVVFRIKDNLDDAKYSPAKRKQERDAPAAAFEFFAGCAYGRIRSAGKPFELPRDARFLTRGMNHSINPDKKPARSNSRELFST